MSLDQEVVIEDKVSKSRITDFDYGRFSTSQDTKRNIFKRSEIVDYQSYLKKCIDYIAVQCRENAVNFAITPEQIFYQFEFWKVKHFVWPNISHRFNGQVILYWTAGGYNLHFETMETGGLIVNVWNDNVILQNEDSEVDVNDFMEDSLGNYYRRIIRSYHPNWRRFFDV